MRSELDHFRGIERDLAENLVPLLEQNGASLYRTEIQGRREARVGWPSTRADGHRTWVFMIEGKGSAIELTLWVGAASGLIGPGRPLNGKKGGRPKEKDCGSILLTSTRFPDQLCGWITTAYAHAKDVTARPDW